jgi:hypothetical protein
MNDIKREVAFWGCLVTANVWLAADNTLMAWVWIGLTGLVWYANLRDERSA